MASSLDLPEQLSSLALGKSYTFFFFILRLTRFSLEINGWVRGISTFAGLIIGSAPFKRNKKINMQMSENGWMHKNR